MVCPEAQCTRVMPTKGRAITKARSVMPPTVLDMIIKVKHRERNVNLKFWF
jgi:hypothetical protein